MPYGTRLTVDEKKVVKRWIRQLSRCGARLPPDHKLLPQCRRATKVKIAPVTFGRLRRETGRKKVQHPGRGKGVSYSTVNRRKAVEDRQLLMVKAIILLADEMEYNPLVVQDLRKSFKRLIK